MTSSEHQASYSITLGKVGGLKLGYHSNQMAHFFCWVTLGHIASYRLIKGDHKSCPPAVVSIKKSMSSGPPETLAQLSGPDPEKKAQNPHNLLKKKKKKINFHN